MKNLKLRVKNKVIRQIDKLVNKYLEIKDTSFKETAIKSIAQGCSEVKRYDVINYLFEYNIVGGGGTYLEIGVRNPDDNFNKINAAYKISVDPGIEFKSNPVDYQVTSDEFFDFMKDPSFKEYNIKFDVIFIDGLHLADQVERDIENALNYLSDDGFIVLHDCNPPSEWHARESYYFHLTPARGSWNGTTWKGFVDYRTKGKYTSCTIDTDWGIGVISKKFNLGANNKVVNKYYEYHIFEQNRKEVLNLVSFDEFRTLVSYELS